MSTETITKLTPAEFRAGLQELLKLATQYAALERRIESKAMELERSEGWDDDLPHFVNAIAGELKGVVEITNREHDGENALELCQRIQDTLDVVTFAIERDDRKEADDAS